MVYMYLKRQQLYKRNKKWLFHTFNFVFFFFYHFFILVLVFKKILFKAFKQMNTVYTSIYSILNKIAFLNAYILIGQNNLMIPLTRFRYVVVCFQLSTVIICHGRRHNINIIIHHIIAECIGAIIFLYYWVYKILNS